MSCSNPDFLLEAFDTPKQVKVKVARSFCEPQNLNGNVAMMLAEQFIFPLLCGSSLDIVRSPENGGSVSVTTYEELEHEFMHGSNPEFPLHPGDLKNAVRLTVHEGHLCTYRFHSRLCLVPQTIHVISSQATPRPIRWTPVSTMMNIMKKEDDG
ncbi:hypothetical protein TELCIR_18982 [Teladorsagia circumcincta]|uniref:Uncharacterized protein n=1 Tax=Teladorsagia circumcincta TaxID=45464 RepID=A0A2G9TNG9_TELCI|nr:hypothetical protein TELCIR_18982 [Teladorsagia circumcincta]